MGYCKNTNELFYGATYTKSKILTWRNEHIRIARKRQAWWLLQKQR
jgi:hypothetical protein